MTGQGLWQKKHIALFAFLAMATSSFGQTFFVAIFGAELRLAFDLSHTAYGGLYSAATLISAVLLLRAGPLADEWPLHRVTAFAIAILAVGCLLIGLAPHAAVLGLGFLCIRFGGQGMIAHIAIVSAGRYFRLNRGKAVAIAAAGIPFGEAILPVTGVLLIALGGWRLPWLVSAGLLLVVILPALVVLARYATRYEDQRPSDGIAAQDETHDFTRAQALRDPGLYMLLPAKLAAPFIVTAVLFHQVALADERGWSLELVATAFTGFALGHFLTLLVAGPIVDRIGAQRSLPLALLPMTLGLLVLALGSGPLAAFFYLALVGATVGAAATAGGALLPERYGSRHLGAIRSVTQAAMVLSTALAPVVLGVMLDQGITATGTGLILAAATALTAFLARAAPPARHCARDTTP